ncbi:hypothetical protein [Polyangium aurulentum]|uniref:hypothetical protein n=1 Tax=Polyangium aurulentum TaxID=2567896 RepID=UPI0010ADDDCF|nr:hypothetical protein [Polyangium aurulentum]UQA59847.1 hypothetical protein E8A73_004930 [Polyangium aurulentum]
MQNDDRAFVNSLLSLSTQLPDGAAPASALAAEVPPLAQGKSVAAKLDKLAASERNEVCHQKWWEYPTFNPAEEADSAEHLTSAELLASVKAAQD